MQINTLKEHIHIKISITVSAQKSYCFSVSGETGHNLEFYKYPHTIKIITHL